MLLHAFFAKHSKCSAHIMINMFYVYPPLLHLSFSTKLTLTDDLWDACHGFSTTLIVTVLLTETVPSPKQSIGHDVILTVTVYGIDSSSVATVVYIK